MIEDIQNYLNEIRRDFMKQSLNENDVKKSPYEQFAKWFEEAVNSQILDPYAMTISTVDAHCRPSSRVVYLRDISENGMIFYTNYLSRKGHDLARHPSISVNFYWAELERQIRIEGSVSKVPEEKSDEYFAKRPRESQIGAWASEQSNEIANRNYLEERVKYFTEKFKDQPVPRPPHWGGYLIQPHYFEYWQGRPNRLHDRIVYQLHENEWKIKRLAP
jgi:pyridoxamine 5'-phosphate oxidase